jgi:putative ABC transport system permease protein
MIPAKYNVRNLRVRWMTTLMTVLSTGLVVWASVLCFGLTDGLRYALQVTGHELDLIVLRKGSADEIGSGLEQKVAREVSTLSGIAKDGEGRPMCSVEFVTILTKPRRNNGGTVNLIVRGLEDVGRELRPDFRIVEGRDLEPGKFEAITSRSMAARFENLAIGEKLEVNRQFFEVVGYFERRGVRRSLRCGRTCGIWVWRESHRRRSVRCVCARRVLVSGMSCSDCCRTTSDFR